MRNKLFFLALLLAPGLVSAANTTCTYTEKVNGVAKTMTGHKGVLVDCVASGASFFYYIHRVIAQNTTLLIAAAIVLVVYSGVQYMLALGNSTGQGAAKQRIVGIIGGIIFFTLIRFVLSLLSPELNP